MIQRKQKYCSSIISEGPQHSLAHQLVLVQAYQSAQEFWDSLLVIAGSLEQRPEHP